VYSPPAHQLNAGVDSIEENARQKREQKGQGAAKPSKTAQQKLLESLVECARQELVEAGVAAGMVEEAARGIAERICSQFGGGAIYFPKGVAAQARARWERLYSRFLVDPSIDALSREFNYSRGYVRKIIAKFTRRGGRNNPNARAA